MKNISAVFVVGLVLLSGVGAFGASSSENQTIHTTVETVSFSPVMIQEEDDCARIVLPEATSVTSTPGGYALPVVTRVYTFPFRTRITEVSVRFSEALDKPVSHPVQQVQDPLPDTDVPQVHTSYSSETAVDTPSFSYHLAAGRQHDQVVTFVAIHLYPVGYLPAEELIRYAESAQITVTYLLPEPVSSPASTDAYDLLIIAPEQFAGALQPLVTHKTDSGMPTKLVLHQEICDGVYFTAEGRDCAEEMKYFIKNAYDTWGIQYVLLVGGRKGGILQETWWLPMRYSQLNDGQEGSYPTDLYFADLYDAYGNFSSWDSNNNGVFAEWTSLDKDILDMYPEVGVGRLPCTSVAQVKTMVQKLITYETTTYGAEWFKRFVGVAGDTYPEANDYYEGEMATNASFAQLQGMGFTAEQLWTSTGTFTDPASVIDAINKGCGFVHFSGHGNPHSWGNHPPRNESFVYGPNAFEMYKLKNHEQQPVVIVGGCHNAQFNTSLLNMVKGVLQDGLQYFSYGLSVGKFWYMEWIPRCWAWSLASRTRGGAIAVIANSGLGYGERGEDTLTQRGRHLEWLFFKSYSDGNDHLGDTHATDLIYYMNEHPPMADKTDCKIVQEWVLLGDPSLMIGGYQT
ncbi:MAG: hypothetical protein JXA00_01465 [Candidatus Thermoplasmatota archaeon]|nr:hypothetical protein [Candidatus Thermoplasmatota archaeon]